MPTIKDIDDAWAEFKKYTETAEQHEFVQLAMIDKELGKLVDILHEEWNTGCWNESHALSFLNLFYYVFTKRFKEKNNA